MRRDCSSLVMLPETSVKNALDALHSPLEFATHWHYFSQAIRALVHDLAHSFLGTAADLIPDVLVALDVMVLMHAPHDTHEPDDYDADYYRFEPLRHG